MASFCICILKSPLKKLAKRTNKTSFCVETIIFSYYAVKKKFKRSAKCLTMKSILFNQYIFHFFILNLLFTFFLIFFIPRKNKNYIQNKKTTYFHKRKTRYEKQVNFFFIYFYLLLEDEEL